MTRSLGALLALALAAAAQVPEQDRRNTYLPNVDTRFEAPSYPDRPAWEARAAFLRQQILSAAGLLPLPEKRPLRAEVFGRLDREGYSIEKVLLETYPGLYLGGNLYRPRGRTGRFPAVVSPHGHWTYGRLENQPLASVPARGISLARQGFVVFAYDMVGWNDTTQLPHGFTGPRETLWSINVLGVQLWNGLRAVDFLQSLPDVDPARIAATGASGGGTQTFLLAAVDERVRVAAPVNMISLLMQGGSQCENAPNLRVRANNVELGGLIAPRPLLMVAATGDWTRNTPQEEFPAMQAIYRLLGAESEVESVQFDAPHNYHQASREAVYRFFRERLLGLQGPIAEESFRAEHLEHMLALHGRPLPEDAVDLEAFLEARVQEAEQGTASLRPHDAASLARAREAFRERLTFSLLVEQPARADIISEPRDKLPAGQTLLLGRRSAGDRIAAAWLEPARKNPAAAPTLLVHPEGVAWVLSSSESSAGFVRRLLDRGVTVLGIDAFQTGHSRAPRDRSDRFFTTYNQTDDAHRVQDILTAIEYLRGRAGSEALNLVGFEIAGVWTYFARALADDRVNLAADLAQFRAGADDDYVSRFFVPGIRKAGDFRAAAVLASSGKLLLHNAGRAFPLDWVRAGFEAAGGPGEIRETSVSEAELLNWLAPQPPPVRRRR
jgi:dienelactone hydrolase